MKAKCDNCEIVDDLDSLATEDHQGILRCDHCGDEIEFIHELNKGGNDGKTTTR